MAPPLPPTRSLTWWFRLNLLGFALAVIPSALRLAGSWGHNDSWEYAATEWLINSAGGTTRRGLSGDLLLALPGVPARTTLVVTVSILLAAVGAGFALLVGSCIQRTASGWPLLFWLTPGGLVLATLQANVHQGSIADTSFATRKEYAFLLVILGVVLASARWPSRRAWPWIACVGLSTTVVGVFVHEALGFVTGGVLAYFLGFCHPDPPPPSTRHDPSSTRRSRPSTGRRTMLALVLMTPIALAVAVAGTISMWSITHYRDAWSAVDATTRAWLGVATVPVWGADSGYPAAMWWLAAGPEYGIAWLDRTYLQTGAWRGWAATAAIVVLWVYLAARLLDSSARGRRHNLVSLAVVLALLSPMFVLATDWGRWVSLLGVVSGILVLGRTAMATSESVAPHARGSTGTWAQTVGLVAVSLALFIPVAGTNFFLASLLA